MFLVHSPPRTGPKLHQQPYAEVFVIEAGEATFELAGETIIGTAGEIVVAPAPTSHGFTNTGTGTLRMTTIHPTERMHTDWLE